MSFVVASRPGDVRSSLKYCRGGPYEGSPPVSLALALSRRPLIQSLHREAACSVQSVRKPGASKRVRVMCASFGTYAAVRSKLQQRRAFRDVGERSGKPELGQL